jgi:CRISPR-associated protein
MEKKINKGQKRGIVEDINEKDGTFKFKNENEYRKIIKKFKNDIHIGSNIKYKMNGSYIEILEIDNSSSSKLQNEDSKKDLSYNKNSEKKYENNETVEKIYIDDNREIDLDKDYYPYNFVSLGESSKAERHEVKKGKFSGKIKCSLKNLTPLFIGGNEDKERTLVEEVEECHETKDGKECYKVTKYMIPASTIKGELRNIIEVLTRSCIKNVEDERLIYRAGAFKLKEKKFGIIKTLPNGKNDGIIEGADVIRIERELAISKVKSLKKIGGKNNTKDYEGFYEIYVNKNKVNNYKANPESYKYDKKIDEEKDYEILIDRIAGCMEKSILWIGTEFPRRKKGEKLPTYAKILVPNKKRYKFSAEEYNDLKILIEERNNSKKPLYVDEIKKDDPIIFKVDRNDRAINLVFSEIPRLRYKCSPLDLIPEKFKPCINKEKLCFACRVFGTIGDNSKSKENNNDSKNESFAISSRIFITDALSLDTRDEKKEKELDRLRSLGEPHPTLLGFYLKYGDYDKRYDKGKYEIRGRKFYWHHTKKIEAGKNWENYRNSIETKNHDNTNSKIYFLEPLQKFEFEIDFKDLTEKELGILLYSIEVEEGKSLHKLGKAKAYGFGSCEIKIDKCLIETEKKYIFFDKNDSFKEYSKEEYTTQFIEEAKKEYFIDSNEREEIKELKYILNRNNILNFSNNKSSFPEIEKGGKPSTLNWFMNNKDYKLPTISNYIKEAEKKGKK